MKITNSVILSLILVISAILRFYHFQDIPYTHDEFSALFRTNFNSFTELLEKGVKGDGHPAGVQIFLYYWIKTFGAAAWVVKLPFILSGIASVYMIFLLGKNWFNATVGLLASTMMATIQYMIMYSQIARPYSSGLFFVLLTVLFWTKVIRKPQANFTKNAFFFVLFATLCAYNHHFSLLFVAIIGVSGLFFIGKEYLWKYILCGLLILLLYLPHIPIFLFQLKIGGVAWLGKPNADFIGNYLFYVLNYSWATLFMILGLLIYGIFNFKRDKKSITFILFSFLLFVLPFVIAYLYSVYVHAIIQFSILIFSFPFILLGIFGFLREQKVWVNMLFVGVLMTSNLYSLVFERKHYEVFYNSCYEQLLIDFVEENKIHNDLAAIIDLDEEISSYYFDRYNVPQDFKDYNEFESQESFVQYLSELSLSSDKLFFSGMYDVEQEAIPIIQEFFPKLVWTRDYAGGSSYYFTKDKVKTIEPFIKIDFDTQHVDNWKKISASAVLTGKGVDGSNAYLVSETSEYPMSYEGSMYDFIRGKNDFVDISLLVKSNDNPESIILVCSMSADNEQIYWTGGAVEVNFSNKDSTWTKVIKSVKLSDIHIPNKDVQVKFYIWNKSKAEFIIDNFEIELRKGNERLYGLFEPL